MRTLLHTLVLIVFTSLLGAAQNGSTPQKGVSPAAAEPTAIIHTSAGDLHCKLLRRLPPSASSQLYRTGQGHERLDQPSLSRLLSTASHSMTARSSIV